MGLGAQGPGRGGWVGVLERPGTGEQSRDSAMQSQKVDSRKGQVGTALSKPAFSLPSPLELPLPKEAGG